MCDRLSSLFLNVLALCSILWMGQGVHAQQSDTLQGFQKVISGEQLKYFSPLQEFAPEALLTRATGKMPVAWQAPTYKGKNNTVVYELLVGHSSGTSSDKRNFDFSLNGVSLFTITTPKQQKGYYELKGESNQCAWKFKQQSYDVNGDAFGWLYIQVPAAIVKDSASFTATGSDQQSRDWLMVFTYARSLKVKVVPTQLVLRESKRRQLNISIDNPYPSGTRYQVIADGKIQTTLPLQQGYNQLRLPVYSPEKTGYDRVCIYPENKPAFCADIELKPVRDFNFHIIHHSHNDIGYSHLQTEVAQIQTENIRAAMRWIEANRNHAIQPYWHIESLWAVENFLAEAEEEEQAHFFHLVKEGSLVLTGAYANILTGLCRTAEQRWWLEYGQQMKKRNEVPINAVMTTDIPGMTWSGLNAIVQAGYPYLSFGPNYVASLPDQGDRIGSMLREQGDKAFWWKPDSNSEQRLLVWTAGRGYSCFHNITDSARDNAWEERLSNYCEQLIETGYPYQMVQLRYTKKADNGPVDTTLCDFVQAWNQRFLFPQLTISSLPQLFKSFETQYGNTLPEVTGEISPYWEDGAFSSAAETFRARELATRTLALEAFVKKKNKGAFPDSLFYPLHRNLVLYQEHTWGSWCSISDPDLPFTTKQWKIKAGFLEEAEQQYRQLQHDYHFTYKESEIKSEHPLPVSDIFPDRKHGGLSAILIAGKNLVAEEDTFGFFEPVYIKGINPSVWVRPENVKYKTTKDDKKEKIIVGEMQLPTFASLKVTYHLQREKGLLTCEVEADKDPVRSKESMHLVLPFELKKAQLYYGNQSAPLRYPESQLPGSNKEFICMDDHAELRAGSFRARLLSDQVALLEIENPVNENTRNGVKSWSPKAGNPSRLWLYVFNNYWHTNYKASQEGMIHFKVTLQLERIPKQN